jgi:hypothetical protein
MLQVRQVAQCEPAAANDLRCMDGWALHAVRAGLSAQPWQPWQPWQLSVGGACGLKIVQGVISHLTRLIRQPLIR